MKITPAMVEAGVAAMARNKPKNPNDESMVNLIYSAMDHARRAELARAAEGPQTYHHQDWPAWRYSPEGEGKVFNAAHEVPEGWTETVPDMSQRLASAAAGKRRGRPPKAQDAL